MTFKYIIQTTCICLAATSFSVQANLLSNGDFETGDLTGWNLLNTDSSLQQNVVLAPAAFSPPLSGFSYIIRPGNQAIDAGIGQSVSTVAGNDYNWSIDIAAREAQSTSFALGTFELLLDGTSVVNQTLTGGSPFSASYSGVYTALDSSLDFQLIFNRPYHSFTANPQWFADNALFTTSAVPLPTTAWFVGIGLLGLVAKSRCKKT